jgi:putative tricarboxylic transport membrane protein
MMQAVGRSTLYAVLFCTALYLFTLTRQFDFPRVPGRLGPDVWPQAILVLLMITCAIGIGRNILAKRRPELSPRRQDEHAILLGDTLSQQPSAASGYGLVAGGFLLFLAYPVVLEYLGFLLATFLLMALFMLVGQWRKLPAVLAVSAVGTLALFYVFRGVVYVSLPLGVGPFHDFTASAASLLGMR